MKRVGIVFFVVPVALVVAAAVAFAGAPPATTFVAVLSADEEVPHCALATNAARGVATFHVKNDVDGTVEYKIVANNLPGDIIAAHIHIAPDDVAGPSSSRYRRRRARRTASSRKVASRNPALVAAIRANPGNYYVNVHTAAPGGCPPGVIRGQLDDHGPANN